MATERYDAVVVGSGPNGLAAAIVLAQAGRKVLVVEMHSTPGGGARSAELTLPGFTHDVCSAIHPLGAGSPFFQTLPLDKHGLEWVHPPVLCAHPLEGQPAAALYRDIKQTAATLGPDGAEYARWMGPLLEAWPRLSRTLLAPLGLPRPIGAVARFGLDAIRSAQGLAQQRFYAPQARALLAGNGAHAMLPLDAPATAAFAMVLMLAGHAAGWPMPRGGAQRITDALAAHLRSLDGEIWIDHPVTSLADLPPSKLVIFDLAPRGVLDIAGDALPAGYRDRLRRFRHGPGVFKIDWALSDPIPWRDSLCAQAGTVHLGGTLEEIAVSEARIGRGQSAQRPFVLLVQPTRFDPSRAPAGKHIAWAYCHVPSGCGEDMTEAIEAQVERSAPGFGQTILARHTMTAPQMQAYNPNYVGGDINAGAADLSQLFFRPVASLCPYATPNPRLYICSASTPPGGGVHGMCGYHAARAALGRAGRWS